MRKIWVLVVLAGCSAPPQVDWPTAQAGPAPDLLPLEQVLGQQDGSGAAASEGAALAEQARALKARVALAP